MKTFGCPLAWLLVFQSRSVRLANTKHITNKDNERLGKREKPLPKGFKRKSTISLSLYKLSPSTVIANKPSSWGKAWRGEESTSKPKQKLCYDFFRANPLGIQQQIPWDVFLTLHITPYALSRGNLEGRLNQQNRHSKTQQGSQRNGKEKEKSKTNCRMFTFRDTQDTTKESTID
jgi:hypothetical protein